LKQPNGSSHQENSLLPEGRSQTSLGNFFFYYNVKMSQFRRVLPDLFGRCASVLVACCTFVSAAYADPNHATQATYEHMEFPELGVRKSDLDLNFKKKPPIQNLILPQQDHTQKKKPEAMKPYSAFQTLGSLFFVLVLFGCAAFWMRKGNKRSNLLLGKETWQVLGRGNLGPKHDVQLVRLGNRILLLGHSPNTIQTLVEITDPSEVQAMLESCHTKQTQSGIGFPRKLLGAFMGHSQHTFDQINPANHPAFAEPPDA
tara:strand:- start:24357 stop:25130 length:774 start_codon:yes stop_codon:yes gene_type:complete